MKRQREPEPVVPQRRAPHAMPGPAGPGQRGAPTPPPNQSQKLTTNDALSYLREVKVRFADRKNVYDTFLDIMKEFKAQRIDTSGVIVRVKQLFKGHRELILGFNTFLPKGYEIELARVSDDEEEEEHPAPKQAVEFDQAISYVNKIKTRFANDERVYKAFLEILNMYRKGHKSISHVYSEVALLFQNHEDLLHEFTYFLPDNSQQGAQMRQMMRQPGGMAAAGMRPGGNYGAQRMAAAPMQRPALHGMAQSQDHSRMAHKRKAARRAEEGFGRMDGDDVYGRAPPVRGQLAKELQFLDKVKTRLRSKEQYGDFLKCLNMYSQEIISRPELVHLVADILGRTPDLMAQFQQFMASCEQLEVADSMGGLCARAGPPMNHRDLLKAKLQKDKFMTKPLSEIVIGESERVTPSYVKMPVGYPKLHQTGRTDLGDEVLNDLFVNVITGSEDYSFKLMRKNQYEEALFRCEDDRYEFDIACEQNKSTIRVFRPIAERLSAMTPEERAHFTWPDARSFGINTVHMGHVQRLYGESGQQLVDLLMKNPAVAIPVILCRLEQKDIEWRKIKEEMVPTWKKIFEQNYPRSLDHRSFYFKQAEKKCMMTKTMVAEVKEAADRRKADEGQLKVLSMAYRHCIPATAAPTPDLAFSYPDTAVFEDAYMAVRAAADHQLHHSVREQVLTLYLATIEPFFGLPERTEELSRLKEEAEDSDGKDEMDVADLKSSSSDQDVAANGEEVQGPNSNKASPLEGTPEPSAEDMKPQGSGEAVATDLDDQVPDQTRRGGSADTVNSAATRQCKPIMPWLGVKLNPRHPIQPPGKRLLFANEHMYVFFRYHRYLYERLSSARKFSLEVATKKATAPVRGGGPLGVPVAADLEARTPQQDVSEAQIKDEADVLHGKFLASLKRMLSTGSDVGAFEDQVRSLLGTNSYELFTLDKLVTRIVKQLQLMVTDDPSFKLWDMLRYEQSRGRAISAAMYHVNCHTVLDETCYRVEFSDDDCTLRFQQNDAERSDSYLAPEAALPAFIATYINNTSMTAAQLPTTLTDGTPRAPLFLRRTLPAGGRTTAAASDESLHTALADFWINNGLETKIACASNKVSYVLDTEDTMVRKVRRQSSLMEAARETRLVRFSKWLAAWNEKQEKAFEEEEAVRTLAAAALTGGATDTAPA